MLVSEAVAVVAVAVAVADVVVVAVARSTIYDLSVEKRWN